MGIAQNLIPESSNLNDYTSPGTYRCINAAIAQSLENCPVDVAFKMIVDVGNDYWIQKIPVIASSSAKVYQRIYRNSAWGSWQTFLTNADLGTGFISSGAFTDIVQDGIYYVSNNVIGKPGNAGGTYILASPYGEATTQCGLYIENLPNGGVYKIIRSGGDQQHIRIDQ